MAYVVKKGRPFEYLTGIVQRRCVKLEKQRESPLATWIQGKFLRLKSPKWTMILTITKMR